MRRQCPGRQREGDALATGDKDTADNHRILPKADLMLLLVGVDEGGGVLVVAEQLEQDAEHREEQCKVEQGAQI